MIERIDRTPRKRAPDRSRDEPLPTLNRDIALSRAQPEPSRESLVTAATPNMAGSDTLKTAALVTGAIVAAPVAASLAAGAATAVVTHKGMDKMSTAVAGPITEWIISLGALNPFKKVWNWIVGGEGGDSHAHAGHDHHHHGGGHDHGHH